MNNAIVPLNQERSVEAVKVLANIVHALYEDVFKPEIDFGIIPGTGTKPVLLLPGMEKLMRALELRPDYIERSTVRDFDKPLFFFEYECRLVEIATGAVVSSAIGSANSRESKWRYRNAERVCPVCGKETIIKGKAEYGGGWVCFTKKGGCNTKFADNDVQITNQQVGRVENPDIADQVNTICKIAQKRALSSAIKGAANVSELFTVDLDDLVEYVTSQPAPSVQPATQPDPNVVDGEVVEVSSPAAQQFESIPSASAPRTLTQSEAKKLFAKWNAENVTNDEILMALGVERAGQFVGDYDAANARIAEHRKF